MKFVVIIQPDAEGEIGEIYAWLAEQAPVGAAKWLDALGSVVESLELFPERCMLAPESACFDREIRQALHGVYRVLFTIKGRQVHVLHVRHGARQSIDPDNQ